MNTMFLQGQNTETLVSTKNKINDNTNKNKKALWISKLQY